ncbi:uncharacterized protein [Nothobranchius furzeri]|uniref:uncharacterized protein isoform X2 n=1 Tax=Nothobranchius furzeri TaxID=105023 RepID=UPI003904D947
MYAKACRQPQPVRVWVDYLLHGVGSEEPGSELPGTGADPEACRGHPDPVPWSIGGARAVPAEVLVGVTGVGPGDGGPRLDPCILAAPHQGLSGRHRDFRFLVGKDRGLIAIADLERGHLSGRGGVEIMRQLRPEEVLRPLRGLRRNKAAEVPAQLLVCPLRLTIGLWVVARRQTDRGSH